jgi:RNA polymerase sigma factor (sigma-70 family)
MKIVRNSCYSWLHANRLLPSAREFDENFFPPDTRALNPEEIVLQNDRGDLLRQAMEKLPPNFREVLVLREIEGMSYREIADITGTPECTVMSSLSRARGRLRIALTGLMIGGGVPRSRRIVALSA